MKAMRWIANIDDPKLKETSMYGHNSINLRRTIPVQFINDHTETQEKVRMLAKYCTDLHKGLPIRTKIYLIQKPNQEEREKAQSYEQSFEKIIEGLPNEVRTKIRAEEF